MSALDDLFEVGKLVGRALTGELPDALNARTGARDAPPETQAATPELRCVRCDGEGEVVQRSVVVPCPVCRKEKRDGG